MGNHHSHSKQSNPPSVTPSNTSNNASAAGGSSLRHKKKKRQKIPLTQTAEERAALNAMFDFVPKRNHLRRISSEFIHVKTLGSGASCSVNQVRKKTDNTRFAMKTMKRHDRHNIKLFPREVNILKRLMHPNIVTLRDTYTDEDNFYILTELCSGGQLLTRVNEMRHFSERIAADIIVQLLSAVEFIHSHNIVHRDIKLENIVYDRAGDSAQIVLIDFGHAREIQSDDEKFRDFAGTPQYVGPEILRERYGWELKSTDMWSVGVIAYALVMGRLPFTGSNEREIFESVVNGQIKLSHRNLSRTCKTFIRALLTRRTRRRLTAAAALEHDWIVVEAPQTNTHLGQIVVEQVANFNAATQLQKLLVNYGIQEMDATDAMILKSAFREIDISGDGIIDIDELERFLERTGLDTERAAMRARAWFQYLGVDDECDELSYEAFLQSHMTEQLCNDEFLTETFAKIDADNNGQISAAELTEFVEEKPELGFSADTIHELINSADQDGDGLLSFAEFSRSMRSLHSRDELHLNDDESD